MAHDYNNMLTVILGYIDLTLEKLNPADIIYENLIEVQNAAKLSADITHQVLVFSRKQIVEPKAIYINKYVESILKIIRRIIGEDIELIWKPDSSTLPIYSSGST